MNYIYRLLTKLFTWQVGIWLMLLTFFYKILVMGVWEQRGTITSIIMNAFENSEYYTLFLNNLSRIVTYVTPYLYQLDYWINVNQMLLVFCSFLIFKISWFISQMIVKVFTLGQV